MSVTRIGPAALAWLLASAAHGAPTEQPAVSGANDDGTTIVGEQEAAVGLYLTPWQEEPAGDVDHPPMRSGEPLAAIDAASTQRRADTDATIDAYRRSALSRN